MSTRDDPQEPQEPIDAVGMAIEAIGAAVGRTRIEDQLVEMVKAGGFTWQQVADVCGYATPQTARRAYTRILQDAVEEMDEGTRAEMLAFELGRLDTIHGEMWAIMRSPDSEPATKMKASETLLKVSAARVKLLGLEVDPTKHTGITDQLVIIRGETFVQQLQELVEEDEANLEAQRRAKGIEA
jgi:hypothetical protein